jgi:threonine dehydratase
MLNQQILISYSFNQLRYPCQEILRVFSPEEFEQALDEVHHDFPGTPQYPWATLANRTGVEVWVKHENHAPTGAFKVRGGLIHVARLVRERAAPNGLISATRGNHGQSLA